MPDLDLYSIEAEQALIGAVIIDPAQVIELPIRPEHFYIHKHRFVYEALISLLARQVMPDYIMICEELQRAGHLQDIGGPAYVTQLLNCTPSAMHAPAYAAEVIDLARRREWHSIASNMVKVAHDRTVDLGEQASGFIDLLSRASQSEEGAAHWNKYLSETYDYIEERVNNPKDVWGIPIGYKDFDRITGGLQQGELMILSGKPGVGKSLWAMDIAQKLATHVSGAVYSIEMKGRQVAMRLLSSVSGVPTRAMKSGRFADGERARVNEAIEALGTLPVYMSDAAGHTTASIRADLARLKAIYGIKWFIIDYMLLLNDCPRAEEIERTQLISRNVKLLCRSLDLAGILIHSMNKEGIDAKIPGQAQLRGSGQVSYDADLIVFLTEFTPITGDDQWLKKTDTDNMRTVIFGKGRELDDPRKGFHLVKLPGVPTFGDYEGKR